MVVSQGGERLQYNYAGVIERMERLRAPLEYAWGVLSHLTGVKNSDELRDAYQALQARGGPLHIASVGARASKRVNLWEMGAEVTWARALSREGFGWFGHGISLLLTLLNSALAPLFGIPSEPQIRWCIR